MADIPGPYSVTVHPYRSRAKGSCAYELGPTTAKNAILFVGGLFDGPQTVPYIRTLSRYLEGVSDLDYSVFETRLRSSFIGFGTSSLKSDVEDISAVVKYLRSIGRQQIVLFGHSTGCQDCMEYTDYEKHGNSPVDAFIMQAPVSDREAMKKDFPNYDQLLATAEQMVSDDQKNEYIPRYLMPAAFDVPITAYRLRSLLARGGDDDYFSSDLDDATRVRFWSRFTKPVLVMYSEEDEFVPPHVIQADQLRLYRAASPLVSQLSGCIPEATHALHDAAAQNWMADSVCAFLRTLK